MFLLLFWFNPLAWVGYRAFRQSQELACDALVLKDSDKFTRVAYAKAMLLCAEQDDGMFYTSIHYGAKNDMQERLLNIKQHTGTSFWRWSAVAVSMMVALLTFHSASAGNAKSESEVRPLTRIEPLYPPQAAEEGIEGSVVLSFDINTQGKVENVKVIQAQPKGIFDRNSKIALRQWVYSKPPETMKDMHVQLDYALSSESKDVASLNSQEIEQIKVTN